MQTYWNTLELVEAGRQFAFHKRMWERRGMRQIAMAIVNLGYVLACSRNCKRDHSRLPG